MTSNKKALRAVQRFGNKYHYTMFYVAVVVTLSFILQLVALIKGG